jgi:hypothetical protein
VRDTTFTGRLIEETRVGPYAAVVPTLPDGFTVGDIW